MRGFSFKPQFSFTNHILKWKDRQVDPLGSAFAVSLGDKGFSGFQKRGLFKEK